MTTLKVPKKMTKSTDFSLKDRLRKAGIRHFDVLIHDQPKEWLIKNFSQGADEYPVNVARLMRNIIWQTRERIANDQKPPLKELIRTFWYMYISNLPFPGQIRSLTKSINISSLWVSSFPW